MNPSHSIRTFLAIAAVIFCASLSYAQRPLGSGPIAPIGPIPSRQLPVPTARTLDIAPAASDMHPDTHTLASIETFGIGSLGVVTSFLDPGFTFTQSGGTGLALGAPASTGGFTSVGMDLAFLKNSNHSQLSGSYRGAQLLYYPNSGASNTYQNLGVADEFHWSRWVLRFRDDLLISPDATFGGINLGGVALNLGAPANNLQPQAGAGDTILTQQAKRTRNTTSGEVNYFLSRRSIITLASSYSSLTFKDPAYIDSHSISASAGYDYVLSPKDTIGLIFNYGRVGFSGVSTHMQTDSVQFAFGRRITGRLAMQFTAGPQQVRLGTTGRTLGWALSNALNYQTHRTQYSLAYTHTSSSGAGVFLGADNHTTSANVRYALTQAWSASVGGGYALNRDLDPAVGTVHRIDNWFSSALLERSIGRHMRLSFNYGFQKQGGGGACPAGGCGATTSRQNAGMTLQWHPWAMGAK